MAIFAVINQKGGVCKTTATLNITAALVKKGKRVLAVDFDHQGDLTKSFGVRGLEQFKYTIANLMHLVINDTDITRDVKKAVILHTEDGVDLIPANSDLAATELTLVSTLDRERVLSNVLEEFKDDYDYIFIDCPPSLGMLSINALASADKVIIPTLAEHLSVSGIGHLFSTIAKVKKKMNRNLSIAGILFTKVALHKKTPRNAVEDICNAYEGKLTVFKSIVPDTIRVSEASVLGQSMFRFEPNGKAAQAYLDVTNELLELEKN